MNADIYSSEILSAVESGFATVGVLRQAGRTIRVHVIKTGNEYDILISTTDGLRLVKGASSCPALIQGARILPGGGRQFMGPAVDGELRLVRHELGDTLGILFLNENPRDTMMVRILGGGREFLFDMVAEAGRE